ncbi:MAG: Na(+)/H(+) antiporter subunit B [Gaiellaceae bacterium]
MTPLQATVLGLVALFGTGVVLAYDPLRQVVVNGFFGLSLVLLFVVFQAPDVAISELVVSTVAFPLVLLVAIGRTRGRDKPEDE